MTHIDLLVNLAIIMDDYTLARLFVLKVLPFKEVDPIQYFNKLIEFVNNYKYIGNCTDSSEKVILPKRWYMDTEVGFLIKE